MKKIFLWTLISFSCIQLSAQITIKNFQPQAGASPGTIIFVSDAESGIPLEGANVQLVTDNETKASAVTNRQGEASINRAIQGDSVKVIISFLGYKTLEHSHKISSPFMGVKAKMSVDPQEISSIIIVGKQVAMITRGDTTIFKAGAFRTMRNAPLSDLLKKLPGIEYKDGNLYAQGKVVRRILINGTPLFGNYTQKAGELIRADEVEDIKVYDKHLAENIARGDTLRPKERVVDVKTKTKKNIVKSALLSASAGVYLDKNKSGSYEELYSANGQYDMFEVGNNLMAYAGYGNKASRLGTPTNRFNQEIDGAITWQKKHKNYKYDFQTHTLFNHRTNTDFAGTTSNYFPTDDYDSRIQTNEATNSDYTTNLTSKNGFLYVIDKRNTINANLDFIYLNRRMNNRSYSNLSIDDAPVYRSDLKFYDGTDNISVTGSLSHKHKFKKAGRRLNSNITYIYDRGWGNGWSIDTLTTSTQNIYLTNGKKSNGHRYSGETAYSEPLSKWGSIRLRYNIERRLEKSQRISIDRLTGLSDMNNSYDFTNDYLKNQLAASFNAHNKNKKRRLNFNASLSLQHLQQNRNEIIPGDLYDPRTFINLLPSLSFSYRNKSEFTLNYSESALIPSVEQLRGTLNTYRAPLYTAGNPSLKETIERRINLMYSLTSARTYSSLKLDAKVNFYQNYIINKEIFFTSESARPEFGDFKFPAGSTLHVPVNVKGRFNLKASADYSVHSTILQSSIRSTLTYSYDRVPYYLNEVLNINNMHAGNLNLNITSNFSQKIELFLFSLTGLGYYERDCNSRLKEISEMVSVGFRWNFAKRLWLKVDDSYRFRNTTEPGTALNEFLLNAEFACTFGKRDQGSISLNGRDLLNQAQSFIVSMDMNRIDETRMTILGRNIYLTFSYRF